MTSDSPLMRLSLNIALKTEEDFEAKANFFSDTVQFAGGDAKREHKTTQ
jgi:hypothetical protein